MNPTTCVLRRPTAVFRRDADKLDEEGREIEALGEEFEDRVGRDCVLGSLSLEVSYVAEGNATGSNAPIYGVPPRDAAIGVLLGAWLWSEHADAAAKHGQMRVLVFDLFGLDVELLLARLGPWQSRTYASVTEALEPVGFWIPHPPSMSASIAAVEASLTPEERVGVETLRARYPVQFSKEDGWLWELRKKFGAIVRERILAELS